MWCHEIGREQAANKPLLRTVFQVMMTLFSPRRVTLMFVIRDKSKTPLEYLERDLKKDIQTIWDSVPKPQAHKQTPLSEFFNVKVEAFSNYERDEDLFTKEVASLRQQFFHSITPGRLAGDRRGVVPASGFSLSAQRIWGIIKENKDLNLPEHRVMVATVRCKEISREKFAWFSKNKDWCKVEKEVQHGIVSGFGMKLNSLIDTCLSQYDTEATFYDEGVRNENRKKLEEKLLLLVQLAYKSMMKHIRSTTLLELKEAFKQALREEKEPPEAVSYCTSTMTQFDKRCADADIRLADLGTFNLRIRDELQHEIHGMATRTSIILEKSKWDRAIVMGIVTPIIIAASCLGSPVAMVYVSIRAALAAGVFHDLSGALDFGSLGISKILDYIDGQMIKAAIEEAIIEIERMRYDEAEYN